MKRVHPGNKSNAKFGVNRLALVSIIFILIATGAVLFLRSAKVSAGIGISSSGAGTTKASQSGIVKSSNGTLVAVYDAGTAETPNGLVFRSSTNNGVSWSSATQIAASPTNIDYSMTIDGSDNIYIVYQVTGAVKFNKLTYSGGSWTVGSQVSVPFLVSTCTVGSTDGSQVGKPQIVVNSSGTLIVKVLSRPLSQSNSCLPGNYNTTITRRSTDGGSTWGSAFNQYACSGSAVTQTDTKAMVSISNDLWTLCDDGTINKDAGGSGSWTSTSTIVSGAAGNVVVAMASAGSDELDIMYETSAGIKFVKYTISTNSLSSVANVSTTAGDLIGGLTFVAPNKLEATYQTISSPGYNIIYKQYSNGSWGGQTTLVGTSDGLSPTVPQIASSPVPVLWQSPGVNNTIHVDTFAAAATNSAPAVPTLIQPADSATDISLQPTFQLRSTDADNDYLQYIIKIYQSDCSTLIRTIDQTSSQTGWSGQDQNLNTAFAGSTVLSSSTIATYSYPFNDLVLSTSYCWSAQAIDPGGSNTLSGAATPQQFTTITPQVIINPGTNIGGGTTIN